MFRYSQFSKMLGLSSVRGGYAVCYDKSFYNSLVEYMEMMTVGSSIFSQKFVYDVLKRFEDRPEDKKAFERSNFAALKEAKNILKGISPKILTVPDDVDKTNGMFFWGTIIDPADI